jgi:AcrR family transcriptional regulator
MSAESGSSRIRRPRMTSEREAELLATVIEVLREVGYEALTMDAVAARAHCGKATLYRQWQGKQQLVAAALYATRPVRVNEIDTGTLRGDLYALARDLAKKAQQDTSLLLGLAHATHHDPALFQALRETLVAPETSHVIGLVERAVQRGELAALPAATQFLPQMLFGAVVARPIFEEEPADVAYLIGFVDDALLPALLNS